MVCEQLFFSVAEAAKILNLTKKTVYKGIRLEQIAAIRVGDSLRIPRKELFPEEEETIAKQ